MFTSKETPIFGYPEMVKVFNAIRIGRFVTTDKLKKKHLELFGEAPPSETVLFNITQRALKRFKNPPLEVKKGMVVKTRSIKKEEISHLSIPERVWETIECKQI